MNNREYRKAILISTVIILLAFLIGTMLLDIKAGVILLLSGAALLAVFVFYTNMRYRHIANLNDYLVRVLSGAEAPEIGSQEEGELSILRTNIYKAATMLKAQNEQLANDKTQLAAALADISHQLKTPLTSMMVMNDLLMDETDEVKREELLRTQSAQLDRMNWLIQTLLKLSKLDAGTIELKHERVSAKELLSEVLKPFEIQFELRGISYKQDTADITFNCDKNWTVEALANLIKNCMEHTPAGGTISVFAEETALSTDITIEDDGEGFETEDIPYLFERFYKGKNASKDSIGIGLAFSRMVIAGQNGTIAASNLPSGGACFKVRFYKSVI